MAVGMFGLQSCGEQRRGVGDHHAPAGGSILGCRSPNRIEALLDRCLGSTVALRNPESEGTGVSQESDVGRVEVAQAFGCAGSSWQRDLGG